MSGRGGAGEARLAVMHRTGHSRELGDGEIMARHRDWRGAGGKRRQRVREEAERGGRRRNRNGESAVRVASTLPARRRQRTCLSRTGWADDSEWSGAKQTPPDSGRADADPPRQADAVAAWQALEPHPPCSRSSSLGTRLLCRHRSLRRGRLCANAVQGRSTIGAVCSSEGSPLCSKGLAPRYKEQTRGS